MKRFLTSFVLCAAVFQAQANGIFKKEISAPLDTTYQALYQKLEKAKFWVVFEVNMGKQFARFSKSWGEEYNQSQLTGIKSMVICNGWFANKISNLDPELLALCPLRVSVIEKDGVSKVLFARPTIQAEGSPGLSVVQTIENKVIDAIEQAADQVGKAGEK